MGADFGFGVWGSSVDHSAAMSQLKFKDDQVQSVVVGSQGFGAYRVSHKLNNLMAGLMDALIVGLVNGLMEDNLRHDLV